MKKDFIKGIITGFVITSVMGGVIAFADPIVNQIEAVYNNIKIVVNGQEIIPDDGNGNPVAPFISEGTTYLPVRAVSNALGNDVGWDGSTNTVYIQNKTTTSDIVENTLPVYAYPNPDNSITMSSSFIHNNKIYVPLDEVANALNCRLRYNDTSTVIASRMYLWDNVYGTIGNSEKMYKILRYQFGDEVNDSSSYAYFMNISALEDAGFDYDVEKDNGNSVWVYNTYSNYSNNSNTLKSTPSTQSNDRNKYKQELAQINAKYDAMIETVRSSYQNTSGGYNSSVSTTVMAQQIQQYEQQRQNEIDILNAKYGY